MDERGVPLSLCVTGANRHDVKKLEAVRKGIVVQRPEPDREHPQNLCADKGYTGRPARETMEKYRYVPHVKSRGEEVEMKRRHPGRKARRWVVEACHSWYNRFRKILVRYEKTRDSYVALLHLASAIIAWRKVGVFYG